MELSLIIIIILIILVIYYISTSKSVEGISPGYYANGGGKRMIPILPDGAGTDSDFWMLDRFNDKIKGFYKGSTLTRTGCDFVNNPEKMLPWGSKIYIDGGV